MCSPTAFVSTKERETSLQKDLTGVAPHAPSSQVQGIPTQSNPSASESRRRTPSTIRKPKLANPSSDHLRQRYLSKLGITADMTPSNRKSLRPRRTVAPVNFKEEDRNEESKEHDCDSTRNVPEGKKRSVSFDDSVSVCPIPMRKEYSYQIRQEYWGDREQKTFEIQRNAIEFAAENWDWRQVVDDEQMLVTVQGERIHPVHFARLQRCSAQQQFLMIMSTMG